MAAPEYTGSKWYLEEPAVADGNLITAGGLHPLEFTYEIFRKINVMKPQTLDAWYNLFSTKEKQHFFALMESLDRE